MKSIFEEDIRRKDNTFSDPLLTHAEASQYADAEVGMIYGPQQYCEEIRKVKNEVDIPVIASVNCSDPRWWADFTGQIEASGADAIELNLSVPSVDPHRRSCEYEDSFFEIVETVKNKTKIPIAVKMSGQLTAPQNVAARIVHYGANGLVVFNRQTGLDIDIDARKAFTSKGEQGLSSPHSIFYPLRWIAILSKQLPRTDISASGGVHSGEAFVKYLLAGAKTVQVCSLLYREGLGKIRVLLDFLEQYMERQGFSSLDEMRGNVELGGTAIGSRLQQRTEYMELAKHHYVEVDSREDEGLAEVPDFE